MKTLTVQRQGINRDPLSTTYNLVITITASEGIDKEAFVKQRLRNTQGSTDDVFVAVASPAQMEDLPAFVPAPEASYFRDNNIELRSSDPTYLDWVFQEVLNELNRLTTDADVLDAQPPNTELYTVESGTNTVEETFPDPDLLRPPVSGSFDLIDGDITGTVTYGSTGNIPVRITLTVSKPADGLNLFASPVNNTFSKTGFSFELSGAPDSGAYVLFYTLYF